ncbi:MAG: hypothetical protein KAI70_00350 [Candidatus Omnitrophica bacterium]|nr:hypothetical protein [Candidatus Omnitrophota bacterium]
MNKLKILIGVLAVMLIYLPSAIALEGENPVETVNRLTDEMVLIIAAVSLFCIVLGVLILIFGASSPSLRAWGSRLIIGVLIGNFIILAAPWFLDIIRTVPS